MKSRDQSLQVKSLCDSHFLKQSLHTALIGRTYLHLSIESPQPGFAASNLALIIALHLPSRCLQVVAVAVSSLEFHPRGNPSPPPPPLLQTTFQEILVLRRGRHHPRALPRPSRDVAVRVAFSTFAPAAAAPLRRAWRPCRRRRRPLSRTDRLDRRARGSGQHRGRDCRSLDPRGGSIERHVRRRREES